MMKPNKLHFNNRIVIVDFIFEQCNVSSIFLALLQT
jgi:hypothetical protein